MNALPEIRAHSRTIEREKLTRSSVPTIVSNLISEACGGSLACFLGDMSLRSCLPTNKFPLAKSSAIIRSQPRTGEGLVTLVLNLLLNGRWFGVETKRLQMLDAQSFALIRGSGIEKQRVSVTMTTFVFPTLKKYKN